MQHYFANIINNKATLSDGDVHHVLHVMRMKKGDEIIVSYLGNDYLSFINSTNPLEVLVKNKLDTNNELNKEVTLFLPLLKSDKLDLVIQKATELGVSNIVLIKTSRCIVKFDDKDFIKKKERFLAISKEASEQSRRQKLVNIDGVFSIKDIPSKYLSEYNLFAYELDSGSYSNLDFIKDHTVSCLIGPEGGISKEEAEELINKGFKPISLGKRILRAETAAINLLSVIEYILEL